MIKILNWVALVLLIIGGLNWGLIAILKFDLVGFLLRYNILLQTVVYALVGASAIYVIFLAKKIV